jgi:hypothetical protein
LYTLPDGSLHHFKASDKDTFRTLQTWIKQKHNNKTDGRYLYLDGTQINKDMLKTQITSVLTPGTKYTITVSSLHKTEITYTLPDNNRLYSVKVNDKETFRTLQKYIKQTHYNKKDRRYLYLDGTQINKHMLEKPITSVLKPGTKYKITVSTVSQQRSISK